MAYEKSKVSNFGQGTFAAPPLVGFEYCHQFSSTTGEVPDAATLSQGEIAVNTADKLIYIKDAAGAVVEVGGGGSNQVVSSGGISSLTGGQQDEIKSGTLVTTTDGRRWVYKGTGSKTSEASYIELADITPTWDSIASKPSSFPAEAHASSHATGGSDEITPADIGAQPAGDYAASGTDRYVIAQPGDSLSAKYAAAKALTPGGNPLSASNRACLIIMPGVYPGLLELISGEYVDVIGLGSTRLNRGCICAVSLPDGIDVGSDDIRIKGIHSDAFYFPGSGPNTVVEECSSSSGPMNFTGSGTFINCKSGSEGFGGYGGTASATYINCLGGNESFGGYGGAASGTFINCEGETESFGGGYYGVASGTFVNCRGSGGSFGGYGGTASGYFANCEGEFGSFGGAGGTASGLFIDCTADDGTSFGGGAGTITGIFLRCILLGGSFEHVTGSGLRRLCIDGSYVINNDDPL